MLSGVFFVKYAPEVRRRQEQKFGLLPVPRFKPLVNSYNSELTEVRKAVQSVNPKLRFLMSWFALLFFLSVYWSVIAMLLCLA